MIKNNIILLFLLIANNLFAQQFNKSAVLTNIKTDGLHRISISPQIRSFSKVDLSDLRIYGADQKEVPYYIWKDTRHTSLVDFEEFPIVSKQIIPNKASNIIVKKNDDAVLEEIVLNIANSNLIKFCTISGSNDQLQWFGLRDKFMLSDLENNSSTSVFVTIKLPKTNYRYLKFQCNDTTSAPIELLKIGRFSHSSLNNKLLSVTPTSLKYTTVVDQKKTHIRVDFNEPQIVENIDFKISKPNYYKRNARILVNKTATNKHNVIETYGETAAEFELTSNKINSFDLPTIFEKEITIEIDNQDNPALEITNIEFNQLPVYLVADLTAHEVYSLKTGNSTLSAPNYDISNFKNDSLSTLPTASFSDLETIHHQSLSQNDTTSFWQKKWFLWLCISIAALTIFYFSASLLKDMK